MSCEQCHLCYQQFHRAHAFRQLSRETGLGISVDDPSSHGAAKLELCLFVSALTDASVGDSGLLDHHKPIFQKGLATPMECMKSFQKQFRRPLGPGENARRHGTWFRSGFGGCHQPSEISVCGPRGEKRKLGERRLVSGRCVLGACARGRLAELPE